MFSAIADWLVRHRSSMPQWMNRVLEEPARNPDGFIGRLTMTMLGMSSSGEVTDVPQTAIRVFIAPTNYSGQAFQWARALESADADIGARNMAEELPGGFAFPADTLVPFAVAQGSGSWAAAEWKAVTGFTHVLIEAERPIFGRRFGRDLSAEIEAMERAGLSVAFMCHGTDVRDPDDHARRTPWSLYPEDPRTETLRVDAERNRALLDRWQRPTFVSTPDLLADVPRGVWCPVVVDADAFARDGVRTRDGSARIVHAASAPLQKGSHYIVPALQPLIEDGVVDYELVTGVPSSQMPGVFADADIVIDQFRAGSYGVAACEAMAAGCVVIGHVLPEVREHVHAATGMPLPIVEATPDTLAAAVRGLIDDPERMRALATAGPDFVRKVHSGRASARVLMDRWLSPRS
ncbi:hypothetical protein MRBLWO14_000557 [Microbacterium sp. LWO14-1.2]|uniref:glycosyltransferase n=1 Tax=Microbacterium sp. LWO14-1.2 TaxID=3135263 RepID=UPI0031399A79